MDIDALKQALSVALDRLDRNITIIRDQEWLAHLKNTRWVSWGVDISWTRDELAALVMGTASLDPKPHDGMWLKFKTDFDPAVHSYYSVVLAHGVQRGDIEYISDNRFHVVYRAFIPEYCLSAEDRAELGLPPLPIAVWSGTFNIAPGVEIKCHVLDNGQRIIEEDSMLALLENWAGETMNDDAMREFVQWYGKRPQLSPSSSS